MSDPNYFTRQRRNTSRLTPLSRTTCNPNSSRGTIGLKFSVSDPFPNIHSQSPALYKYAIGAHRAYFKVKSFEKTYQKVISSLSDTFMSLDESGKLQFKMASPKSLSKLISDAIIKKVGDEIEGKILEQLKQKMMSTRDLSRYVKFMAVMNNLVILHTIYKDIDNKDLVNNQKGSRRKEADKLKISFLLKTLAIAKVGNAKSPKIVDTHIQLWNQFQDFEKKYSVWMDWQIREEKLAGTYKSYKSFKIPGT